MKEIARRSRSVTAMNRRAKRNRYKNNLRHLENKLREYEMAFERQKFEKKVEVETLTCAIPIDRELEFVSHVPKERIEREQERMVLDHFARLLMERPDLLKRDRHQSYWRYMMKVVKE